MTDRHPSSQGTSTAAADALSNTNTVKTTIENGMESPMSLTAATTTPFFYHPYELTGSVNSGELEMAVPSPTPRALNFPSTSTSTTAATTLSSAAIPSSSSRSLLAPHFGQQISCDLDGPTPRALAFPEGVRDCYEQLTLTLPIAGSQNQNNSLTSSPSDLVPCSTTSSTSSAFSTDSIMTSATSPPTSISSPDMSSSPTDYEFNSNKHDAVQQFIQPRYELQVQAPTPTTATIPPIRRSQSSHLPPTSSSYSYLQRSSESHHSFGMNGYSGSRHFFSPAMTTSPVPRTQTNTPRSASPVSPPTLTLAHRRRGATISSLNIPSSSKDMINFGSQRPNFVSGPVPFPSTHSNSYDSDIVESQSQPQSQTEIEPSRCQPRSRSQSVVPNVQASNPHAHGIMLNGGGERRPKRGDEDYIKRPENAFILFRRSCCLKQNGEGQDAGESAGVVNSTAASITTTTAAGRRQRQADLSKTISQLWRSLSPDERKYWDDLAKQRKKEHEEMYPWYVYQPSRSNKEKKKSGSGDKKEKDGKKRDRERKRDEVDEMGSEEEGSSYRASALNASSRSTSLSTREGQSRSRVRGVGGEAEREREKRRKKLERQRVRARASSITSNVTSNTSLSGMTMMSGTTTTTSTTEEEVETESSSCGFGGFYPYSTRTTSVSSLMEEGEVEGEEVKHSVMLSLPMGMSLPSMPMRPSPEEMEVDGGEEGGSRGSRESVNINVGVLGSNPLASFSLESGPLSTNTNTNTHVGASPLQRVGAYGHGHGHGHGHSLSMSAMSGHSYQPHQEQNHHRNQQQQPQQHLNQSQDQIQRGVSPMGYVLGQSRRSSSASGAPADGPMERMYLPSTSSSSSSPAHTHANVNVTGVSTIKLPTLLGNSSVVEGERQREGGAVKGETSGKCDLTMMGMKTSHPLRARAQTTATASPMNLSLAYPGMGMGISIPNEPSVGGPMSAPVSMSMTMSPSSLYSSPSVASLGEEGQGQGQARERGLFLPSSQQEQEQGREGSKEQGQGQEKGHGWGDDYGLPSWAAIPCFEEQQQQQQHHHQAHMHGSMQGQEYLEQQQQSQQQRRDEGSSQPQSPVSSQGQGSGAGLDMSWMGFGMCGASAGAIGGVMGAMGSMGMMGMGPMGAMGSMDGMMGGDVDLYGYNPFFGNELLDPSQL